MAEQDDAKRIQELNRKLRAGEVDKGVRRVLSLLDSARREIIAEIADSDWDRFMLPRLTLMVDRQLEQWRELALQDLTGAQAQHWTLGSQATLATVEAMGVDVRLPELPTSLLQALQQKTAQVVGGLTRSAKDRLDRTIATSLLSGQPRQEAIAALGKVLETGGGKPQGVFGTIRARSEFIYRHETGQVYAQAADLRREQVVKYVPDLAKVWRHSGNPHEPRVGHVAMHGQERAQDEPFLNPKTREKLHYPRDPGADIRETAGCTCEAVLWRPRYGDKREFIGAATGREEAQAA